MNDSVAEVKAKIDIVDIIGERLDLKKAGRNFKANCPFHTENTPSFMVSPEIQTYKCFGCGEGGDVFTFLEKFEGMEFSEALKYLAERAGVKLKPINTKNRSEKERIYEINALAAKFYSYILLNHASGGQALEYLKKERGLSDLAIKTFGLGYSPPVPFAARKFLMEKHKIPVKDLVLAGLVYQKGSLVMDRFRGRVIFPLHDARGNTVGFAGRITPWDRSDMAKYINSPETLVYHKGDLLYGLQLTRADIKKAREVVVVEGELDLISSWSAGVKNIVALKGTAMTEEQLHLMKRLTDRIVLALDADLAGDAAARRGITIAQNMGMEIRVAVFPGYKDPDEAARANAEALKKGIEEAESVWDFLVDSVFARYDASRAADKSKIGREIAPILAQLTDRILQAHYTKVVAERLNVPFESVARQIEEAHGERPHASPEAVPVKRAKSRRDRLEERLMALSFQDADNFIDEHVFEIAENQFYQKILNAYKKFSVRGKKFSLQDFSDFLPGELRAGFSELMLLDLRGIENKPDELKKEFDTVVNEIDTIILKASLAALTTKIKEAERRGDPHLAEIEEEFSKLSKKLSLLEESAGNAIIS